MSRDEVTIRDMLRFCELIHQFVAGMDAGSFKRDLKTQSAVLHQLMILGEAATRLSTELRMSVEDVQWSKLIGMRNKLLHSYDEVDLEIVWRTLTKSLPLVELKLREKLRSE